MILRFLHWLSRRLAVREIFGDDGTLYLQRFRILGWMPGDERRWPFSIYLHRFHRPDLDDAPHSHPWNWAVSLVLAGGYVESRRVEGGSSWRALHPGQINVLRDDTFHVVKELLGQETWTLFVVGPKTASWGFMVNGRGFVPWRDRLRERGIEPSYIKTAEKAQRDATAALGRMVGAERNDDAGR